LKDVPGFREHPIFLIALLLACTVFLASCFGDTSSNSSPTLPTSHAQTPITPIGVPATCLTIHSPSLVKLADGNYELMDEFDNCGGKDAGPLKVTIQIDTKTTKLSIDLIGPATLPAHTKVLYHTFKGQASGTKKEIQFRSSSASSAVVTILATINGAIQGEWDGQVPIPTR
jgi:hypothetical protein